MTKRDLCSRLKKVLRAHNGMNETNKKKVIDAFLNTLQNTSL